MNTNIFENGLVILYCQTLTFDTKFEMFRTILNLDLFFLPDLLWILPLTQMTSHTFENSLVRLHFSNPFVWYRTWHVSNNFEFWPNFLGLTYFDFDLWPTWLTHKFENSLVRLRFPNHFVWYQTWHVSDNFEFWQHFCCLNNYANIGKKGV